MYETNIIVFNNNNLEDLQPCHAMALEVPYVSGAACR